MPLNESQLPRLLLGAGGHAKVVIDALRSTGQEILGILAPDMEQGDSLMNVPVIGGDEIINQYSKDQVLLINGVGSLPGKDCRWRISEKYRRKKYQFGQVLHDKVLVASDVLLASGVQIMSGAIIQTNSKIGLDTIINTGSLIDHDCIIGSNCHIAPGVSLSGNVTVGNGAHIGTGSTVIQGVHIGNEVVIAAGTTIYKDIPDKMFVRMKNQSVIETLRNE